MLVKNMDVNRRSMKIRIKYGSCFQAFYIVIFSVFEELNITQEKSRPA